MQPSDQPAVGNTAEVTACLFTSSTPGNMGEGLAHRALGTVAQTLSSPDWGHRQVEEVGVWAAVAALGSPVS